MTQFRYLLLLLISGIYAQELPPLRFNADLDIQEDQTIKVSSQLELTPEYFVYRDSLYLYDWNHSYSSKVTPLAKSFRQVLIAGFILQPKKIVAERLIYQSESTIQKFLIHELNLTL
jgi:hypothetical protein